jgi:phage tail sheath protein FI
MATNYKTPGVYIEEIPKFPPSIAQVETAIPVFIGYTEKAGLAGTPLPSETISGATVTEAKRITSLLEYESYFGRTPVESFDVTIEETYKDGTTELKNRVITATVPTPSTQTMYYHMQ